MDGEDKLEIVYHRVDSRSGHLHTLCADPLRRFLAIPPPKQGLVHVKLGASNLIPLEFVVSSTDRAPLIFHSKDYGSLLEDKVQIISTRIADEIHYYVGSTRKEG